MQIGKITEKDLRTAKRPAIIFEFRCVAVLDPYTAMHQPGFVSHPDCKGSIPHAPGEDLALCIKEGDMFLPNLKNFLEALMGTNSSDEDYESAAASMISDAQIFQGLFVEVDARLIAIKNGSPFTKFNFTTRVAAADIKQAIEQGKFQIPPHILDRLFPGDMIDQLIAREAEVFRA